MHPFYVLLGLFGVVCLVAFGFLLRWERRHFVARNKGGAWLRVRLATIPILLALAALVIIPARGTSGMEGLAVFYILLLGVGPFVWFGAHWLVGKLGSSRLTFGESALIAGSPLALGLVLVQVAHMLQPFAWYLLRAIGKA